MTHSYDPICERDTASSSEQVLPSFILSKTPGGVLVGGRVKSGETLGNGCSSTKSL